MTVGGNVVSTKPVGGYAVEAVLGRGGMGIVYRATHPEHAEPVALKLMAGSAWSDAELDRFRGETRIARAVAHRHILPVFEAGEEDGVVFVAMKLAPGGDLGSLIRHEGRLEADRAAEIVRQIAAALDAAHAHGLVHRDVKPGNVLLDEVREREHAYIADFGVTRVAFQDDVAGNDGLVGTVSYASPEQIRGEPIDARGDVYSLGCVLYECLTGRAPFERRDALATMWAHLHDEPPAPSALIKQLPAAVDSVVARAMAKEPADRFQSAGAFAEAAGAALAHEPQPMGAPVDTNLPVARTAFVGREVELAQGLEGLRASRLVTVTGPGGAGKTRYALELARRAAAEYRDGVFACFLASLRDPSLVPTTLCQALDIRESPGQTALEALRAHLADKRLLLLVDNVEHVAVASRELARLLADAEGLSVLATSRELLRLDGELVYQLPPLRDDDAATLFCDRAHVEQDETVAAICRRLDGLPLALELAAAQVDSLPLRELLDRLASRLDALAEAPEADPRQETLRATIQWSYDLLSEREREVFARLSVFAGGCTPEAATEIAGADTEILDSLVDKSLLRHEDDGRFSMLETIRELGAEKLGADTATVRARHLAWFADTMYERRKAIRFEPEELARASRDLDNVRAALPHAIDSAESALAQKAFAGGAIVWLLHGSLVEGDTWATRTLSLHSEETVLLGFATGIAAEFPRFMGDLDRALELKRRALAVLGNMALDSEGERMLAAINTDVSDVLSLLGRFREAESYATQGLAIRRAIGDPAGIAHALEALANVEARSGRSAEALAKLEQVVGLWKRGGRHHEAAQTLSNIAYTKRSLGDLAGARQTIDEALAYLPRTHSHIYLTWAKAAAGLIALDEAHFDECTRLLSEAREQARLAKLSLDIAGEIEEALALCREELGEDRFEEAQAAGIAAAIGPAIGSGDA